MIGLSLSSVRKHNIWSYYDWVVIVVRHTICGRVMIALSLSSVSKHNMWSYYNWVVVLFVSKHNMWSYYDGVVVVVVRQLTQYLVVL